MAKLKLGIIPEDKPIKLTIELPATTHRDLLAYAEVLVQQTGQAITNPARLIARCWFGSWQWIALLRRPGMLQ